MMTTCSTARIGGAAVRSAAPAPAATAATMKAVMAIRRMRHSTSELQVPTRDQQLLVRPIATGGAATERRVLVIEHPFEVAIQIPVEPDAVGRGCTRRG